MTVRCHAHEGCIAPATQSVVDDETGDEWLFCEEHWAGIESELEQLGELAKQMRESGMHEKMIERVLLEKSGG